MKRAPHLVSQHLELISREALEKHQDILKSLVRHSHGIYALYRKNRLSYVGLANNLRSRLNHHLRDRHAKSWDHFSIYLTLKSDHMRELEALAIRIAAPKENLQKGKLKKSQDLKRLFRRTLLKKWRGELGELFYSKKTLEERSSDLKNEVKGRKPRLAGYFTEGRKLRMWHKGHLYRAYLKKNGVIRFKKKLYTSPSSAAKAIVHRGIDGWYAWKFERVPGDWVVLNDLRK